MAEDTAAQTRRTRPDLIRHDIRNPLNVVIGALRLIEMGGVTPQQQKQIDLCRSAVDRITAILDTLGPTTPDFVAKAAADLRALGHVAFLAKPFDRSELLRRVQILARTHRNLRLLAADDVPEVGWLLESLLASSRCSLDMVRDGAAAVEHARDGSYDVILLDLEMPGTNGVDAARAIRERERADGREPVPILIVSGHDLEAAPAVAGGGLDDAGDGDDAVAADPEIAPLVPEFLDHRRGDVERLQAFIEASDWEAVRSLGHRMKGTGRGYGFPRISDIGRAIERAGTEQDAGAARAAADALAAYLDRVQASPPGAASPQA